MKIKISPKHLSLASLVIAFVISAAYFAIWLFLASPFRAFPGDDSFVAANLLKIVKSHNAWSNLTYPNPVYYLISYSVFSFCNVSIPVCEPGEIILWVAIASNAASVFLLGLITFKLTRNLAVQLAVHILYSCAAWPVTYHFMVSYAATTAALVLLTFYLILGSNQNSYWRISIAGITAALTLWSSSSAPLTVFLLITTIFFLLWQGRSWRELLMPSRYDWRRLGVFAASFCILTAVFGYFGFEQYIEHLSRNINNDHYVDADRRFGYVPRPPFFSFFRILGVYGQIELLMFVATLIAVLFLTFKKNQLKDYTHPLHVMLVLGVFVVLHAVLVDLLPFTKLARAHFPVYPVSIIVICIAGFLIYYRLTIARQRRALLIFLLVGAVASAYEGIQLSVETHHVRTTAAKYLNEIRATDKLYVLREDTHQLEMRFTFDWQFYQLEPPTISAQNRRYVNMFPKPGSSDRIIDVIKAKQLSALIAQFPRGGMALLLGPYGRGSGMSLVNRNDFYPGDFLDIESLRPLIKETISLPYYMHYPPFLMEEEVNQALYFLGKTPDYRIPAMGITLLRF